MSQLETEDERLAFFLNLYNLMILHALVVLGPPADALERVSFYQVWPYNIKYREKPDQLTRTF